MRPATVVLPMPEEGEDFGGDDVLLVYQHAWSSTEPKHAAEYWAVMRVQRSSLSQGRQKSRNRLLVSHLTAPHDMVLSHALEYARAFGIAVVHDATLSVP